MSQPALKSDFIAAFLAALAVTPTAGQTASIDQLSDDLAAAIFDNFGTPMTFSIDFPASSALLYYYINWPVPVSIDLDAAALTNVTTVAFAKNGTTVTGTTVFSEGDKLEVLITRAGAADASVELTAAPTGGNITRVTPDFVYPNGWTDIQNMTLRPDIFCDHDTALQGNYTGSTSYDRWAIAGNNEWSGPRIIEFQVNCPNTGVGINTETGGISSPAQQYQRYEFGFLVQAAAFQVRELGFLYGGSVAMADAIGLWYRIDYGGANMIRYYYSIDNRQNWTHHYDSGRAYNPATVCRMDIGTSIDGGIGPTIHFYG